MKFKKPYIDTEQEEVQLGLGILKAPEDIIEDAMYTDYIDMDKLQPNEMNHYQTEKIEELAEAIKLAGGILQNIIVKPEDENGMYTITTGERRWRAARLLKERGEYPEGFHNKVPVTIIDPDKVSLPLDSKQKEMFSILVTNQYREKSDGDKMMEMLAWKEIFQTLKDAGVETISLGGESDPKSGEETSGKQIQLKGVKTRELIAEQMDISPRQVGRMEAVTKKASETTLAGLMQNKMDLGTAEALTELEKEEQEQILEEFQDKEKISKKEIKEKKEEREEKIEISVDDFEGQITRLRQLIQKKKIELTKEDYKKYKLCLQNIESLFEK